MLFGPSEIKMQNFSLLMFLFLFYFCISLAGPVCRFWITGLIFSCACKIMQTPNLQRDSCSIALQARWVQITHADTVTAGLFAATVERSLPHQHSHNTVCFQVFFLFLSSFPLPHTLLLFIALSHSHRLFHLAVGTVSDSLSSLCTN